MSNLIILIFSNFQNYYRAFVAALVIVCFFFIFCIYSIYYFSKKVKFTEGLFLQSRRKHCNILFTFFASQAIQGSRVVIAPVDGLREFRPTDSPVDIFDKRSLFQKTDTEFRKELDTILLKEVFH